MASTMQPDNLILPFTARVRMPGAQRTAALLDLVKAQHAHDPAFLEERTPFFWAAEISSNVVDAYWTHMLPNTLANFRDDARAGVAFLPGHQIRELPFGRSLDASLEDVADPPRTRVAADFYTLPGLRLNGVSTDDLIAGIRAGIISDVSVGFGGWDKLACDICGRDYFDWDCLHIPGMKYEVEENGVKRVVTATFGVDNARLYEVSAVYDGATPNAAILKAEREAEAGRLRPDAARVLEARYRIKLPAAHRAWAGYSPEGQERKEKMDLAPKEIEVMRAVLDRHGIGQGKGLEEAVGLLDIELERLRDIQAQSGELAAQAADGRQYRSDLVAEALAEGVRAYGQEFDKPTYEGMLRAAPLAVVKRMKQDWQTIGDSRFAPGRQTTEGEQEGERTPRKMRAVPDSAYIG